MKERTHYTRWRLADVLALIQVLALDPSTHRSEDGLTDEIGIPGSSAGGWISLGWEHPELFRVKADAVSLVARHVQPKDENNKRQPLSVEFTQVLIRMAIDMHDRERVAAEQWKSLIPLWAALIAAIVGSGTTLLTLWLNGWHNH